MLEQPDRNTSGGKNKRCYYIIFNEYETNCRKRRVKISKENEQEKIAKVFQTWMFDEYQFILNFIIIHVYNQGRVSMLFASWPGVLDKNIQVRFESFLPFGAEHYIKIHLSR